MGNKYIYNKHIAPITCNARDRKGMTVVTVKFQPERTDGTTGRIISTGYTTLTDKLYEQLCESSKTFAHYKDKLGLLVECDDLPSDAKTPQEALVDARKQTLEVQGRVAELEAENVKLKAELHDTEEKLGQLVSASTPEETVKSFTDKITELEAAALARDAAYVTLEKSLETVVAERDAAVAGLEAAKEKLAKGGKGKEAS
jgi:chromosome segregation ATPase